MVWSTFYEEWRNAQANKKNKRVAFSESYKIFENKCFTHLKSEDAGIGLRYNTINTVAGVGKRLHTTRLEKEFTQEQLSGSVDVLQSFIAPQETETIQSSFEMVFRLANTCFTSPPSMSKCL